jgi:hypothetical protein
MLKKKTCLPHEAKITASVLSGAVFFAQRTFFNEKLG